MLSRKDVSPHARRHASYDDPRIYDTIPAYTNTRLAKTQPSRMSAQRRILDNMLHHCISWAGGSH